MPGPARIDTLSANEAHVHAMLRNFNGDGRTISEVPEMIRDLSNKNKVYIFNVGPWTHTCACGSLGTMIILGCADGEEYSKPLELDGLIIERYPLRENSMDLLMHKNATGLAAAREIIGIKGTPHVSPGNSLEPYGVWYSQQWPPTKEEIALAKKNLYRYYNALINEARSAHAQGQKASEETIRPDQHIRAGLALGLDPQVELWMNGAVPQAKREKCLGCGTPHEAGVILCAKCGFVLDVQAYEKNKARFPGR